MKPLSIPLLRFLAVALVAAGLGAGMYFAVQAGGGGEDAQVVAQATETPTPLPPTDTPAPPTPTATQLPPTAVPTPRQTLPPPPPKPEQPHEVQGGEWDNLPGGRWYRLLGCFDFFLPEGWTFSLQVIAVDPGGALIAFTEQSSGASVAFYRDSLSERNRSDPSGELGAAFEQIAATISTVC